MPPTAATTTAPSTPQPLRFTVPIAKIDKDKRLVRGVATAEVLDHQGQIVDYEAAKAACATWVGNVREMHQPKAVGKRTEVVFDDEKKEIILESYISKGAPDTWEKVLDGTLTMYSIGANGKVAVDKVAPKGRLFPEQMVEISLVDNGACPVAKFDIVKLVDGVATDVQAADPADAPLDAPPLATVLTKYLVIGEPVTKALEAVQIAKRAYPETYDIEQTLICILCLQRLLGNEWWQLRDEEAAGEDTNTQRVQVEMLKAAVELVLAFLLSEFSSQFAETPETEAFALSRRAEVVKAVDAKQPISFSRLDGAGQLWIAKAGARHSKRDNEMIQQMHDTAMTLGAICAAAAEKVATPPPPVPAAPVETPTPAAEAPAPVVGKAADPVPAASVVAPAAETPAAPIERTASAAPATPADPAVAVQTLVDSAVTKALEAHKATSDATIAALQQQITALKAEPVPGGPVTRAVPKTLAGEPAATSAGEVDPTQVVGILSALQKEAKSDDERQRVAEALIKYQHASGAGAVVVRPVTGGREPLPGGTS